MGSDEPSANPDINVANVAGVKFYNDHLFSQVTCAPRMSFSCHCSAWHIFCARGRQMASNPQELLTRTQQSFTAGSQPTNDHTTFTNCQQIRKKYNIPNDVLGPSNFDFGDFDKFGGKVH